MKSRLYFHFLLAPIIFCFSSCKMKTDGFLIYQSSESDRIAYVFDRQSGRFDIIENTWKDGVSIKDLSMRIYPHLQNNVISLPQLNIAINQPSNFTKWSIDNIQCEIVKKYGEFERVVKCKTNDHLEREFLFDKFEGVKYFDAQCVLSMQICRFNLIKSDRGLNFDLVKKWELR